MKQLNEFATLEEAQAYSYNQERMISPDMMLALLSQHDSVLTLQEAAKTNHKAAGFLLALQGSVTAYNLMNSHLLGLAQQANLNQFVTDGVVTPEFRDTAIYYANNNITYPYANTTLVEFNNAKRVYTEKEVIGFAQGKNIKVTLIGMLPEKCTLTTWEKDGDFDYQNFGKHCHVYSGQNEYKIKTDNKKPDGKLFVRIPFENFNFTVEVI